MHNFRAHCSVHKYYQFPVLFTLTPLTARVASYWTSRPPPRCFLITPHQQMVAASSALELEVLRNCRLKTARKHYKHLEYLELQYSNVVVMERTLFSCAIKIFVCAAERSLWNGRNTCTKCLEPNPAAPRVAIHRTSLPTTPLFCSLIHRRFRPTFCAQLSPVSHLCFGG